MSRSLSITQTGILLVAVPLFFELVFAVVLMQLLSQSQSETNRALRAKAIIEHANMATVETMKALETIQHGAVPAEGGALPTSLSEAESNVRNQYEQLQKLLASSPEELVFLNQARQTSDSCLRLSNAISQMNEQDPVLENRLLMANFKEQLNSQVHKLLFQFDEFIKNKELIRSANPKLETEGRQLVETALVVGIVLNVLLALALAFYFSRSIGRRLMVINQNTSNLSKGLPLLKPLEGGDEIAAVDRVFHEMAERLKDLDRMKREFVAMISHDLRSPLTSLQGLLTLLESGVLGELPEKAKIRIQPASDDIDRLIRLINELMDVERFEGGKIKLQLSNVAMQDLIDKSINSVKMAADAKKIQIKYSGGQEKLLADSDRIIQVLVNILGNAIKFSDKNSSIEIEVKELSDLVEVRIRDYGRGIPANMREAVFDRFRQVEKSDATEKGGSGLGLAICREIIEEHGGSIGVESPLGQGSLFWFRLPRNISLFG